jgi:4-methyl-5(b-hydroxyethyl)-thiazole monophosphate biosynthesis
MTRVTVPLAEGFEEIEAVTVIDVLRRAEVEVITASLHGAEVRGSHGILLRADASLETLAADTLDGIVLPGGMPGAQHLKEDARVLDLIATLARQGKLVAAICAAPIVLEAAGVLEGRRATSYPGFDLPSATYLSARVVEDGHIVTSRGPGTALEFALALVRRLTHPERALELRQRMLVSA